MPDFYDCALKSQEFLDQFFDYETGNVGQGNVSIRAVKDVTVPLPNPTSQAQVVSEIEARLSEADAMDTTIRQELVRAENLRQSILKQAFEGKLIPSVTYPIVQPEKAQVSEPALSNYGGKADQLTLF